MKYIVIVVAFFFIKTTSLNGQSIQYRYDNTGRLIQVVYPNQKVITYLYDKDGNRIEYVVTASTICSGATSAIYSGAPAIGNTFQWQVNVGTGFVNISNDAIYSGATTNTIQLTNPPTSWYGYKYRCLINGVSGQTYSPEETLKFIATWTGSVSTAWENPANWGCNKVPDGYTDVFLNGGTLYQPEVSSNASVRTITVSSNTTFKVNSGFQFNILH